MPRLKLFNVTLAVAIVFASPLLAGCRASPSNPSEILLTRSPVDPLQAEMDALPRGTLELDLERGCVLLSGMPVVWPTDTTLTSDPPALHLPGGLTARPGDTVYGGGGHVPGSAIPDTRLLIEGDLDAGLECAPRGTEVIVFTAAGSAMSVAPGMLLKNWVSSPEPDAPVPQSGTLELDVDRGCILLSGKPVVWPGETELTTVPAELRLPNGLTARSGDIVGGRGWQLPAAVVSRTTLWIEGDLERSLACAPPAGTDVVVFRGPGSRMTVSHGG